MEVIILRNVCVRGEALEAGPDPVELEKGDAEMLILMGKAHAVEPQPAEAVEATPPAEEKKPAAKSTTTRRKRS